MIYEPKDRVKILYVENHLHSGALGTAKDNVINLHATGVLSGLMIDFGHVFNTEFDHINNFDQRFSLSIAAIQRNMAELEQYNSQIPISFHLPLGKTDCLPVHDMKPDHWKMIADTVGLSNNGFVVIENQQSVHESFILTPKMAQRQRIENEKRIGIVDRYQIARL